MVDVSTNDNTIGINVSSAGQKSSIGFVTPQSYYDGLAKQWAISESLVNNEDYSSKHYAEESKKQALISTSKATIATEKAQEVVERTNEALAEITAQKETSKDAVKAEGDIQVARVQTEGANYATKAEATYTAGTGISIENNVISNTQTSAEWGNIEGNIESQTDLINYVSSKSGGLEVCDIGTALYVDETKGLRRYVNGQIVDANTNTQLFIERLVSLKATNPDYFTNESTWQAEAALNVDGCVYKFVLNYNDDGTTITSVRLPKYPEYVEIDTINTTTVPVVGNGKTLGFTDGTLNGGSFYANGYELRGSTNIQNVAVGTPSPGSGYLARNVAVGIQTNPATSGLIAQMSSQKQTKLKLRYFIQIATGRETENNIVNDIELNNPYVLFDNKYVEAPLYNISWLKSGGEYKPKATYPKAYEALVVEQNTDIAVGTTVDLPSGTKYTKRGLSVKLSTDESATDYDFRINTTDETFRLPLKNGQENLPSDISIDNIFNSITTTIQTFTAPANGWVYIRGYSISGGTTFVLTHTPAERHGSAIGAGAPISSSCKLYVKCGDSISVYSDGNTFSDVVSYFQYAQGNGSLYYYVGETVQNANLIDVGRIAESKLDTPPRYPVEVSDKSILPSWYVVYNNGWCEQGGRFYGVKNTFVNYLKNYSNNTTPNIQITMWSGGGDAFATFASPQTNGFTLTSKYANNDLCAYWRVGGYIE